LRAGAPYLEGWPAHLAFAGYHALVLPFLMTPAYAMLAVGLLRGASWLWGLIQRRPGGGLLIPAAGHLLADPGIALAAWARAG
jgi:hypothetical protein